jgi:uncharacterized protein YndB with AHSA1/START domain
MPTQKDLKRLVRRRMTKTGESYTTARAQLLRKSSPQVSPSVTAPPMSRSKSARFDARPGSTTPSEYPKLAGMSDAALKAKTGCDWRHWVEALDYVEAHTWPHRKIAAYVHEEFGVPGWWTQTVAVGYERIRGLRLKGQRRDGGFEASKSRTFPVPIADLYAAFAKPRSRARWLPGVKAVLRKATPNKSVRMTWPDGTSVEVWFTARGAGKSAAGLQHRKLPDKESAVQLKQYWGERLEALGEWLTK